MRCANKNCGNEFEKFVSTNGTKKIYCSRQCKRSAGARKSRAKDPEVAERYRAYSRKNWAKHKDKYNARRRKKK